MRPRPRRTCARKPGGRPPVTGRLTHSVAMTDATPPPNPRKVRLGLLIIGVILVVAIILAIVVKDPVGRAIFVAIMILAFVRMILLVNWLRRGGAPGTRVD